MSNSFGTGYLKFHRHLNNVANDKHLLLGIAAKPLCGLGYGMYMHGISSFKLENRKVVSVLID